jgi:hypothetical protein
MDNACVGATSWLRLFEFQGQVAVLWNDVGLCGLQKRDPHGPSCIVFKDLELNIFEIWQCSGKIPSSEPLGLMSHFRSFSSLNTETYERIPLQDSDGFS